MLATFLADDEDLDAVFSAFLAPLDLVGEARLPALPDFAALVSCAALRLTVLEAVFDGLTLTPSRRALDRPMAMACWVLFAPCLPSLR